MVEEPKEEQSSSSEKAFEAHPEKDNNNKTTPKIEESTKVETNTTIPKEQDSKRATPKTNDANPSTFANNNEEDASVPAPEIGPGWTRINKYFGPNSKTPGRQYHYFVSPKNKHKFQSKRQAMIFLKTIEAEGNEDTAYRAYLQRNATKTTTKTTTTPKPAKFLSPITQEKPPKRPPSTYLMYTTKLRSQMTKENPNMSPVEISKALGELWKKVGPEEKEKLKEKYDQAVLVYKEQMKEWERKNPGKKQKRSEETSTPSRKRPKSSEWWAVEGFRDRRVNPVTLKEEYLIKWKGCPESKNTWEPSENLNLMDDAKAWWQQETARREQKVLQQQRIAESMERLGLNEDRLDSSEDESVENNKSQQSPLLVTNTACQRPAAPAEGATKVQLPPEELVEDETWKWDDASMVNFQPIPRISVQSPRAREQVTDARIHGKPVVLTGHVGWANFARRWVRRRSEENKATAAPDGATESNSKVDTEPKPSDVPTNEKNTQMDVDEDKNGDNHTTTKPLNLSSGKVDTQPKPSDAETNENSTQMDVDKDKKGDDDTTTKPLDLSDPLWYLDVQAMSSDIGDEEVPVVKKNYNESQPISGNILLSKFLEVGWKEKPLASPPKRRKSILYLHQWQFPLSVEACKKLCHQSEPLPNNILGEDLLKYWLDRVKLDSPLQYLFMGAADTMSKVHKDNGGLAISIAPITGEKEVVLVHRDDGHACLYHNQAPLDPDDIDLNAYPLLPHARVWKSTIRPGEILLMPHGTYHQCRNVTPCLSYSRFHLDEVNLRAFLHSMMDGDAPELHQDEVLWNCTRELIDIVDKATDDKAKVDSKLHRAIDALRALRNIAKEVTRKLHVRHTVKGTDPSIPVVSSTVTIDGDWESWQSLVDDVDVCLHEFRYRFMKKIPPFKRRRSVGRKILALPALPFRGKGRPDKDIVYRGGKEPVVAFECPMERGFLALPEAPSEIPPEEKEKVSNAIPSIAAGDKIMVSIEGRQCPATVTEIYADAHAAYMSFEDLPSVYNDFVLFDLLRTSSVSGSCLATPKPEDVKPGKLLVALSGKDEYRGVVQYLKRGKLFRTKLHLGNTFTTDKLVDSESILSIMPQQPNMDGKLICRGNVSSRKGN